MLRSLRLPAAVAAIFVLFLLPSYVPAHAESQTAFAGSRLDTKATGQPGLWRVKGAGGPVWIFGTIHLLPANYSWRTAQVDAALARTDVIVLEAPVGGEHSQRTVAAIQKHARVHPNQSIRALIPDFHQPRAEEISSQFGLPWGRIQNLPPWLGGVMLAQSLYASLGFNPESGVEHSLRTDPALTRKGWDYFETPEEQLGFFAKQPADVQVDMFLSTLTQMEEGRDLVDEMFGAWASGDIEAMDRLFNKNMKEQSPELFETLVVERNIRWIPKIEAMLRDSRSFFVAVGAGHLGGRQGVLALLEMRGYVVVAE